MSSSPTIQFLQGDCLEVLKTLPDESVHCSVTSPPYWGLRDYGTAEWEGGDDDCDHRQQLGGEGETSAKQNTSTGTQAHQFRDVCGKCGARRIDRQIGLESTPQEYVAKMVEVFREVRRVLRDDGTCWVNLGDSYAHNGGPGWQGKNGQRADRRFMLVRDTVPMRELCRRPPPTLKPKDLCGVPWRVAFAFQADGWWLRSDIVWAKPNPMPESVTDRPTKSHEYLFLLAKSERYYYDQDAIREECLPDPRDELWGKTRTTSFTDHSADLEKGMMQKRPNGFVRMSNPLGRNKRSVWTVPTSPYSEAHFATFPPDLIKPCILAGCPVGGTVLDPFGGSGTTGQVALELGRSAILIELNPEYVELQKQRCNVTPGLQLA